jgi:hypothetical protein
MRSYVCASRSELWRSAIPGQSEAEEEVEEEVENEVENVAQHYAEGELVRV